MSRRDLPNRELLAEANLPGEEEVARKLLGDLACRSASLKEELAECGIVLVTERADRQRVASAVASLKEVFRPGKALVKTLVASPGG